MLGKISLAGQTFTQVWPARLSLAGQPLHKRGRVWCRAYTRVVPALMQRLWIRYEDLAPDWPVCTLGIAPTN